MLASYCRIALTKTAPRAVAANGGALRHLNVQEYVSMDLMRSYGLPTPICYTATTPEEAEAIYRKLNPRKCGTTNQSILKRLMATSRCVKIANPWS